MNTLLKIAAASAFAAFASCAASGTQVVSGAKSYPRSTCLVTDNAIGSMGSPVTKVYKGQEVKFCCRPCVAKFEKDPERYLAKIR
ncbi:YHS domain-containing protein [Haloferula sp. BvORR071]|uniref:YHS domain-containing protein n=1 Tax=Haloferula sp. BvORR071 TaxID=1396141 RepID=UPI0006984BF8|nr:YHS domain-containing protein [Haloferula sp. BvORR071]